MQPSDFTTDTVLVAAQSHFQADYSDPINEHYVFAYRVRITNTGRFPVRLLRRHWIVTDGTGQVREVEGEGVVGQKPLLQPGESHEYTSWVQLPTPIGSMRGTFLMELPANSPDSRSEYFRAVIPRFLHEAPEILN